MHDRSNNYQDTAAMDHGNLYIRFAKDYLFSFIIIALSVISILPLFLIFYYILEQGLSVINWDFLIHVPKPVGETGGGVANAIVGTILLIFIACCLALPAGITTGVYLSEHKRSHLAYWVRLGVEIIQGTPSIVIGVIAYIWIVKPTAGFSALSGGVALSLMMLPLVIRSTEETLSLIPNDLKEASLALGVPYYRTIIKVALPAGLSGIITGILLSISRIAGETAPLLFTAFGNPYMNLNILKPVDSLPHIIYNYAISPYPEWHQLAWAASLILIIMVLLLNLSIRLLVSKWKIQY